MSSSTLKKERESSPNWEDIPSNEEKHLTTPKKEVRREAKEEEKDGVRNESMEEPRLPSSASSSTSNRRLDTKSTSTTATRKLLSPRRRASPQIPSTRQPTSPRTNPPRNQSNTNRLPAYKLQPERHDRPKIGSNPSATTRAIRMFKFIFNSIFRVIDFLTNPIQQYLILGALIFITTYISYCIIIYYALPNLPSFVLWILGRIIKPFSGEWLNLPLPTWDVLHLPQNTDIDINRGIAFLTLPLSALATTSCALTGFGCEASFFTTNDQLASSIWTKRSRGKESEIGDAHIAWALAQEGRSAKTIFDSIATLGTKADVFQHIELWKHGVAIKVESNLESRNVIGQQLFQLGELSKDLHDEMRGIDSMTVMTFGNLHLEFSDLTVQLLDPSERVSTSVTLARRFDNVLSRLDPNLDELILRVERAVAVAQLALDQGKQLSLDLTVIAQDLSKDISSEPLWKRSFEEISHFLKGGEEPISRTMRRDRKLVDTVVEDIGHLLDCLELARTGLKDYQSHTASFKASLYGVHLASNGTLELEDELRILAPIIEEFGMAIDQAKGRRLGTREVTARRIDSGRS